MKKLFFSFVMMIALVIVAGSAMAQIGTSNQPYLGATYTYTVNGLDQVNANRAIEVFLTLDNQTLPESARIDKANFTVSNGSGISNIVSAGTSATTWGFTATLDAVSGSTPNAFSFDVTWGSALTIDVIHNLWVKVYDGASGTCYNMMHLNVTPKTNILDYKIVAAFSDVCPTTEIPTSEKIDGIADNTIVTYTVTRIDGVTSYNWEFVFDGNTISVPGGVDTKIVTTTVSNTPGSEQTVTRVISGFKQYVGTSSVVNSNSDKDNANNSASTIIKRAPSIGGFTGN